VLTQSKEQEELETATYKTALHLLEVKDVALYTHTHLSEEDGAECKQGACGRGR